jgi:integrase
MTTTTVKTWNDALEYTWRVKWKRTRGAKTALTNANHITQYAGKSLPLKRLTVAGWWLELKAELEEGRSGSTVNRILSAGSTVFNFTHLAGLHKYDMPVFPRAQEGACRIEWFTKDDVDRLCSVSRDLFGDRWGDDLADAMLVSAYTGIRQGELLKLKSCDYDSAHQQIWIGGKPGRLTKNAKGVRNITLHPKIQKIILDRLDQEYLFRANWDNKDQLYRNFCKVRKIAGFSDDYVWHCLRHSFGTWMGAVTHPRTLMEALGHKTIDMSLKYCKATDEAARSAVLAL